MINRSTLRFIFFLFLLLALSPPPTSHAAQPYSPYLVQIADVGKSKELASVLSAKGFRTEIPPRNVKVVDEQNNCAVWIGKNIPLEMLRVVIPEAIRFYPHLQFFHVVGDRGEKPPSRVHDTIHIGGSMEGALAWKLNPIEPTALLKLLAKAKDLEEVHRFLHEKNSPREETSAAPFPKRDLTSKQESRVNRSSPLLHGLRARAQACNEQTCPPRPLSFKERDRVRMEVSELFG